MRLAVVIVAVWGWLGATSAHAQSDADDARAREHFQAGQKLSAQGRFDDAFHEFASGHALSKRPLFLFNMAECARQSGKLPEARALYERYLRDDPGGKQVALAKERVAELERAGVAAAPEPPPPDPPPATSGAPPRTATARPDLRVPDTTAAGPTQPRRATGADLAVTDRAPRSRPLWKRSKFWIGVGIAATVVVAGTVTVFAVTGEDDPCGGSPSCIVVE